MNRRGFFGTVASAAAAAKVPAPEIPQPDPVVFKPRSWGVTMVARSGNWCAPGGACSTNGEFFNCLPQVIHSRSIDEIADEIRNRARTGGDGR